MSKPKKWDTMTEEERVAWMTNQREKCRRWRLANIGICRAKSRERYFKNIKDERAKKRISIREARAKNPEKFKDRDKKYRESIKGKESRKQYDIKNREKIKQINRKASAKRRKEKPEKIKESQLMYYERNIEKIRKRKAEFAKNYRKENPEKIKAADLKMRQDVATRYIAVCLRIPIKALKTRPDLIEAKRDHIKAFRQLKQQTEKQHAQEPE